MQNVVAVLQPFIHRTTPKAARVYHSTMKLHVGLRAIHAIFSCRKKPVRYDIDIDITFTDLARNLSREMILIERVPRTRRGAG